MAHSTRSRFLASASTHRPSRRDALGLLAGLGLAATALPARSDDFPNRKITIVVAGTTGTAFDIVSRVVADMLRRKYDQPVLVENRPGASTMIGMRHAARQAPDGYTLVAGGLAPMVMRPAITKNLPVDMDASFVPIAQLVEQASCLVARPDFPVDTVQDLIAMARAKPGDIRMGTNDIGSSPHMCFELFAVRTNTKWLHVPYPGPTQIINGLTSDTLDAAFSQMPPVLPLVRAGRLKILAVTTSQRAPGLPDVPTLQEAGIKDFEVSSWLSMHGIAGTPEPIIEKLSRDIVEGLAEPEVKARLENASYEVAGLPAAELARKMKVERALWVDLAQKAGISLDFKS